MIDPMTSLAFSVYSGKGVHALLLGSGVSMTSGIPTGWEIVLELVRKLAEIGGQDCGDNPAAWYQETYGEEPDYTKLLELVAKSPAERQQLLRGYFEPTPDERAQGKKTPTPAHKAIARLVADGYVRVIVTTNFDQLLENALREQGVIPAVIASPDSIKGAKPMAHSGCTVIKVHGDYLDTRMKNTPKEVEKYNRAMKRLLRQVFDEYGLIVCGWSADWDVALRDAIESCPNRRYTMYWSAYRNLSEQARRLCEGRDAQVITGMDADGFFAQLSEKIAALKALDSEHPLSIGMAVATLKRYMADDRDRIKLHDFAMAQCNRAAKSLFGDPQRKPLTLAQYELHLKDFLPLLIAGGYYGSATHRKLWLRCFVILTVPRSPYNLKFEYILDYYPAYLCLYAFGIASLAAKKPLNFAYVIARANIVDSSNKKLPLLLKLHNHTNGATMQRAVEDGNAEYKRINNPLSNYLYNLLKDHLADYCLVEIEHAHQFSRFEYILALIVSDMAQRQYGGPRFGAMHGLYVGREAEPLHYEEEIDAQQARWPYLRAGLFNGSLERLREVKEGFELTARELAFQMHLA